MKIFWRPLPIFTLTVRQFAGGKAVRVVAALAFLPALLALVYLINPDVDEPRYFFSDVIFRGIAFATLIPVTVLVLATGAFGNEIEDQTLSYLVLKPVTRLRIVLEKYLAVTFIALPLVLLGTAASWAIVFNEDLRASSSTDVLAAALATAGMAVLAYAALFLLVSLLIPRALLAGVFYILVWESLLGRYLPGLRTLGVSHYTESIFVMMLGDSQVSMKSPVALGTAVAVLVGTVVVSLALATWRLRRLNLD